ncbi:MAG: glycosyltransferase family 4 protein [Actinobacteria bacterium]|nr:glycosyltransferase family 4 protein [Actinomycetota bacterium]
MTDARRYGVRLPRIGLDATPLLGRRTGVGNYTSRLMEGLADSGAEVLATAFTFRGRGRLREVAPAGVTVRARPVPARALRWAWQRSAFPPVEALTGRLGVFHATNFVLPPLARARGVVTVHDLAFLRYPQTVDRASLAYRELVPRGIERASIICTPSHAVADELTAEFPTAAGRVRITPLGVDESWFDSQPLDGPARRRLGLPERYVIAVGTVEPRKNLDGLVRAYRQARGEEPQVPPLVIVGPPGWGPALGLTDLPTGAVILTGYLDDAALRGVVAGATALAFPSRYEGFGLPPLEALAAGVPVIASDLPVTREVLGDTAELVRDQQELAAALVSVSTGTPDADVARRGRERAAEWTWQRCTSATIDAYLDATN